ncbi:MAG: hypothetical protein C0402_08755 [Thermodesulfovibrio sp.]|nr:hypothetical protein [Thermodesulfovibrio sp.]
MSNLRCFFRFFLRASALSLLLVLLISEASAQPIISEFRLRGPNGANDEFVEIYNNSDVAHTVTAASGTGYAVAASDGVVRCTIPNGTVIPARGYYLCVNSVGYSLAAYPAGNGTTATGDATYATDIPDNAGIALFNNNTGGGSFILANRLDAVGSTSEANTLYKEGTGYPALTPFSIDYSFARDECGKGGSITTTGPCTISTPKDTDNNAADFYFVDTNGTSAGAGQRLGAPGPQNLSSPVVPGSFSALPLDATVGIYNAPNTVRDFTSDPPNNSTFGTLSMRARFVNTTGGNVTRIRFRIVDQTTFPAPSGVSDLRARTSLAVVVAGINDAATCAATGAPATPPCTVTVQGTTLEQPPSSPNGSAFNASMSAGTVTLGTPLANGASINLQFLFGIQQTGDDRVTLLLEGLPNGGASFYRECDTEGCATTVTGINPTSGPVAGGTAVTITGTNLTGATSVTIGGAAATSVVVVNATTITAVTPAGTAGARDVVVTAPGGTGTGTGLFTYIAAPTVTGINPTSGPAAGGTVVTITGTNLTGATSVTIGGAAATSVVVVNDTTITAVMPAGTAGAQNVVVTTPGGTGTGTGLFTYMAAQGSVAVPTMNEWGMILFMAFAGLSSVYYLRRQRRT